MCSDPEALSLRFQLSMGISESSVAEPGCQLVICQVADLESKSPVSNSDGKPYHRVVSVRQNLDPCVPRVVHEFADAGARDFASFRDNGAGVRPMRTNLGSCFLVGLSVLKLLSAERRESAP